MTDIQNSHWDYAPVSPNFLQGLFFMQNIPPLAGNRTPVTKVTSSLARNSAVPAANLVCQEHARLSNTRDCFDGYSFLVSGLINGAEIEDWALTTSTQATKSIGCEVHNDCDAVSDDCRRTALAILTIK